MTAQHHVRRGAPFVAASRLVTVLTRWPVESQQRARRNAMVASTALAHRRAELDDVERFLAARRGNPTAEDAAEAANG